MRFSGAAPIVLCPRFFPKKMQPPARAIIKFGIGIFHQRLQLLPTSVCEVSSCNRSSTLRRIIRSSSELLRSRTSNLCDLIVLGKDNVQWGDNHQLLTRRRPRHRRSFLSRRSRRSDRPRGLRCRCHQNRGAFWRRLPQAQRCIPY